MQSKFSHIPTASFAKMCGTTKRTLFFYEEIGLFSPIGRDENDYRYYSQEQYETFECISALREMGMPLEEIRTYIQNRNPEALKELLTQQEKIVADTISNMKRIETMIRTKMELLEINAHVPYDEVQFMEIPAGYLFLSGPLNSSDPEKAATVLYGHLSECSRLKINSGHPYGAMLEADSVTGGRYREFAYYFTKMVEPFPTVALFEKPAGIYATLYMKGDYHDSTDAFQKLIRAVNKNNYSIRGYSYKEGIIDEIAEKDFNRYVNKISIHVTR